MPVLDPSLSMLASQQNGLLTREQLLTAGWSDGRVRAAARRWSAVLPGIYLVSGESSDRDTRAMAAMLRWPAAALSHDTAARWRGWPVLDRLPLWPGLLTGEPQHDPELVHVTSPTHQRVPPAYRMHQSALDGTVDVRGARLTEQTRTLLDVLRESPLTVSVPLVDAVCRMDPDQWALLNAEVTRRAGRRNMARAARALSLTCPTAESVLESLLRLLLVLAGLPEPNVQVRVKVGGLSYRADLGYPDRRVLIEADGRDYHAKWADVAADMARQNALVGEGWRVLRFTWRQVLYQPELVVRAVRDALRNP